MRRTLVVAGTLGVAMLGLAAPAHADKGPLPHVVAPGPGCVGEVANFFAQAAGPNGPQAAYGMPGIGNVYGIANVPGSARATSVGDLQENVRAYCARDASVGY